MDKVIEITSKILAGISLMLLPIQASLIVVFGLVMADLIVGVWASYKEGYVINSRSLRRTISKLLVYEVSIIMAFMIETHLLDYPITKAITGLIGLIESKSFFENLYRITKVDFLRIVIDKFQLVYDKLAPSSSKDEQRTYRGKKHNENEKS